MKNWKSALSAPLAALGSLTATTAFALPTPGGISMLEPGSKLAEEVAFFHNVILLPMTIIISVFVLALLVWVMVRYNRKANPVAQKFSHNTLIEVIWTGIPVLILLAIWLPSIDLLYKEDVVPDGKQTVAQADGANNVFVFKNDFASPNRMVARSEHLHVLVDDGGTLTKLENRADYTVSGWGDSEVTVTLNEAPARGARVVMRGGRHVVGVGNDKEIAMAPTMALKVNGYQWGWSYAYPDFGDFEFASNMLPADQTTPELYRFEVDNRIVVPVGETIRVLVTARDVIHAWALPAFAVKIDAVPGRINETWFKADREGVYYGQCSEICGIKHAFMPIAVEVVSRSEFEKWVDGQRALAGLEPMFDAAAVKLASAENASAGE